METSPPQGMVHMSQAQPLIDEQGRPGQITERSTRYWDDVHKVSARKRDLVAWQLLGRPWDANSVHWALALYTHHSRAALLENTRGIQKCGN